MSNDKRVAVVAGATRGAGRGIARGLGEAGFTVVCTGRSLAGRPSPYGMPETLDETAAMIPGAVAVRVDHTREDEVQALFARVLADHGRIDVVVDSVAGEDPLVGGWGALVDSDLANAEAGLRQTVLSHIYTAKHGARAMRTAKRGLLVEVVEHDLLFGSGGHLIGALAKSSLKCLAAIVAEELRPHGVAAVSITPGFLRSEAVLRHFGVTAATWREAGARDPHFLHSESPLFIGRAVAALATDPDILARTGHILSSWEVARAYGLTDEDGTRPDWGAHWRDVVVPTMRDVREGIEHQLAWLEQLATRARAQLEGTVSTSSILDRERREVVER